MKRPLKIAIWCVAIISACGLVCLMIMYWLFLSVSKSNVSQRELSASELSSSLKHLNPNIHVIAGYTASSYDGFHGDGGSVDIYLIDPSGADELIAGLKRYHETKEKEWPGYYMYDWSQSSRPDLSSLDDIIPARFQARSGDYVIGRDRNGIYTISIERQQGYVCFSSSRW